MASGTGFTGNVSTGKGADKRKPVAKTSINTRDLRTFRRARAAAGILGITSSEFIEQAINDQARAEFKDRGLDLDALLEAEEQKVAAA